MEVIAAIGWLVGLAALAAVGWGQQKLTEARALIERKSEDAGAYKQQLSDMVRESNASLSRVREQAASDKQFAHEPVVKDLLEVVDSFERALETLPEGQEADGVRMIHKQLLGVLARHGVERVASEGSAFDPEVHEAIGTEPSAEHDENTVLREWCGGYRLHDRVLRAAKVVLAVPVPPEPTEDLELDVTGEAALPGEQGDVSPEAGEASVPAPADDAAPEDVAPGEE